MRYHLWNPKERDANCQRVFDYLNANGFNGMHDMAVSAELQDLARADIMHCLLLLEDRGKCVERGSARIRPLSWNFIHGESSRR